jgi:hypothetical protein
VAKISEAILSKGKAEFEVRCNGNAKHSQAKISAATATQRLEKFSNGMEKP